VKVNGGNVDFFSLFCLGRPPRLFAVPVGRNVACLFVFGLNSSF
jgi:hypothetical protein